MMNLFKFAYNYGESISLSVAGGQPAGQGRLCVPNVFLGQGHDARRRLRVVRDAEGNVVAPGTTGPAEDAPTTP